MKPPESDSQSSKLRVQFLNLCTKFEIDGETSGDIAEIVDRKTQAIEDIKKQIPPLRTTPPFLPVFSGFMTGATAAAAMDLGEAIRNASMSETEREIEKLQNAGVRGQIRDLFAKELADNQDRDRIQKAVDLMFPPLPEKKK